MCGYQDVHQITAAIVGASALHATIAATFNNTNTPALLLSMQMGANAATTVTIKSKMLHDCFTEFETGGSQPQQQ